ncbi:hypothetical protein [Halalkalicoccus salilacus]
MTTVIFVAVSLLTEVEDPQAAREFIEATRPRPDGSEPERTARETPADD